MLELNTGVVVAAVCEHANLVVSSLEIHSVGSPAVIGKVWATLNKKSTYEQAKATRAPLTTMKSRMFHRSRK